jgi:hypothetical protein
MSIYIYSVIVGALENTNALLKYFVNMNITSLDTEDIEKLVALRRHEKEVMYYFKKKTKI